MLTRSRITVLVILMLVMVLAAWSRLRHVEESDHQPQRVRLEDHPAFQKQ